jgi:ATP-binding cassette subfamily B protein
MTTDTLHEDEYSTRFNLGLWRRILGHARPYRGSLLGLCASGMLMAVADTILPRITGWIIDDATLTGSRSALVRNSLLYAAIIAAMAGLIWIFIAMAGRLATGMAHDIRRAAFAHLQELSFSYYDRRPVGWLMARLTSDADKLSSVIPWFFLDTVWGTTLVAGISVMMLILNWRLALLVMLVIPPLAVVSVIFQRMLLRTQRAVRRTNSQITAGFNEAIVGVRTTKALVREEENLREFRVLSGTMYEHSVRNALQAAVYLPIVLTLGSVGVGLALWRGGVDVGAGMSLGTIVAFMQYAATFYIPIREMADRFTQMQSAQASAERLQQLLDTEPEVRDAPEVLAAAEGNDEERIALIEFEDVSFAYVEGEPVLVDFNLRVEASETIALVGATGSGKTTIVSLLGRFYEPTGGSVKINGVDYRRRRLAWLQSKLGIVLQSPHLFSGSIRENIRYGRLDATDDEVIEAAKLVGAHAFITAFEDGYETNAGEGGGRLSTGQRQLISLARAILADPQIFIMDEATSSVDTETERAIQKAIETVLRGRISFVIAHRLSTIRSADRILVIDRGRVLEEGNHETLIRARGRYYRLYTSQFTRESQEWIFEAASESGGVA